MRDIWKSDFNRLIGSLTEVQNQLLIARDVGYIGKERFAEIASKTVTVSKLLHGLVKSAEGFPHNT